MGTITYYSDLIVETRFDRSRNVVTIYVVDQRGNVLARVEAEASASVMRWIERVARNWARVLSDKEWEGE